MQAIVTKYVPATDYKPSRIKAKCERGSHTIAFDYEGDPHVKAADALCRKFAEEDFKRNGQPIETNPWMLPRVNGGLPGGNECHVFLDHTNEYFRANTRVQELRNALEIALATINRLKPPQPFDSCQGTRDIIALALAKSGQ